MSHARTAALGLAWLAVATAAGAAGTAATDAAARVRIEAWAAQRHADPALFGVPARIAAARAGASPGEPEAAFWDRLARAVDERQLFLAPAAQAPLRVELLAPDGRGEDVTHAPAPSDLAATSWSATVDAQGVTTGSPSPDYARRLARAGAGPAGSPPAPPDAPPSAPPPAGARGRSHAAAAGLGLRRRELRGPRRRPLRHGAGAIVVRDAAR